MTVSSSFCASVFRLESFEGYVVSRHATLCKAGHVMFGKIGNGIMENQG